MKEFLKDIIKDFRVVLIIIFFVAMIVTNTYLSFSNPDMTRTRLFLTYWPTYIVELVVCLLIQFLIARKK